MAATSAHPARSGPSEGVRTGTLIVLAGIGGYIDAVSYLGLGRLFTAAMTGNTVLLALALAVVWYVGTPHVDDRILHALIVASALAMGVQSATARRLGVAAISTTYETGTLTSLTSGTVEWLRSAERGRSMMTEQRVRQPHGAGVHGPARWSSCRSRSVTAAACGSPSIARCSHVR